MTFRKIGTLLGITLSVLVFTSPAVSLAAENEAKDTPAVPFKYALGQQKYQALCSECHGNWADGTEQGPPLVHDYYKPSHHGDSAFYRAVQSGTRAHHWNFGDMLPVPQATPQDVKIMLPFIRWLQRENGIY